MIDWIAQLLGPDHWALPWVNDGMICVQDLSRTEGPTAFELRQGSKLVRPARFDCVGCGGWDADGIVRVVGIDLDVGHGGAADQYASTEDAIAAGRAIREFVGGAAEIRLSKSGVGVHVRVAVGGAVPHGYVKREFIGVAGCAAKWIAKSLEIKRDNATAGRQNLWFWAAAPGARGFELVEACAPGVRWTIPPAWRVDPDRIASPAAAPVAPRYDVGTDRGRLIERAHKYLQGFQPAVQGNDGSGTTMKAAAAVVRGFDLTIDEAFPLLWEWNAKCVPPWTEKDLRKKLHDANQKSDRGWLKNAPSEKHGTPGAPKASARVLTEPNGAETVIEGLEEFENERALSNQAREAASGDNDVVGTEGDCDSLHGTSEFQQGHNRDGAEHGDGQARQDQRGLGRESDGNSTDSGLGDSGRAARTTRGASAGDVSASDSAKGARSAPQSEPGFETAVELPPDGVGFPPVGGGGDGQAAPLGAAPRGDDERPVISNYRTEWRYVLPKKQIPAPSADDKECKAMWRELQELARLKTLSDAERGRRDDLVRLFQAERKPFDIALPVEQIRREIAEQLNGWPQRLSWGMLFVDPGLGKVRFLEKPVDFMALLKEYAIVRFNPGQDADSTNYVNLEELCASFRASGYVTAWNAVEEYPFAPALQGHYVTWKPPEGYAADGRYFVEFLKMFDNVWDNHSKAIFAAAICTPFWGGEYAARPAFIFGAEKPRSGKSTAAFAAARLCGDYMMINLDRRSEERTKERWLSPEGRTKRVGVIDNQKRTLDSELMEELVTCTYISGKVLGVGEGSRPNVITYIITANNPKVSPDFARRCFYVKFKSPDSNAQWQINLYQFLKDHAPQVVADILFILKQPVERFDPKKLIRNEGFPLWCQEVLSRVVGFPAVAEVVGNATAEEVTVVNQERREEADQDLEDAMNFGQGVLERIVKWKGYKLPGEDLTGGHMPTKDVFVRTVPPPKETIAMGDPKYVEYQIGQKNNMAQYYREIMQRDDVSAKWLKPWIENHILADRLPWMRWKREATQRGFYVSAEKIVQYMESQKKASDASRNIDQDDSDVTQ